MHFLFMNNSLAQYETLTHRNGYRIYVDIMTGEKLSSPPDFFLLKLKLKVGSTPTLLIAPRDL